MITTHQINKLLGSGVSWLQVYQFGIDKVEKARQTREEVLEYMQRIGRPVVKETVARDMDIKVGLAHTILCEFVNEKKLERDLVKRGSTRVAYFNYPSGKLNK
jgi:hypothetical protein